MWDVYIQNFTDSDDVSLNTLPILILLGVDR